MRLVTPSSFSRQFTLALGASRGVSPTTRCLSRIVDEKPAVAAAQHHIRISPSAPSPRPSRWTSPYHAFEFHPVDPSYWVERKTKARIVGICNSEVFDIAWVREFFILNWNSLEINEFPITYS